ncbi:hypothetical protein IQ07DRAFT_601062 [Pyrenochaeta sp. DS3sAY3a]|nr:hypothetical protein IQ07DRAFT_601062 [Pyrenochaeta sp. DS3sAY3a]
MAQTKEGAVACPAGPHLRAGSALQCEGQTGPAFRAHCVQRGSGCGVPPQFLVGRDLGWREDEAPWDAPRGLLRRPPACASSARAALSAAQITRRGLGWPLRTLHTQRPRLVPPTMPACSKGRLTTYTTARRPAGLHRLHCTLSALAVALCPPARASLALAASVVCRPALMPTYLPQPSTSSSIHTRPPSTPISTSRMHMKPSNSAVRAYPRQITQ